jgi:hypothetical protein
MKNKKYLWGSIATGLVFCAAIICGSFLAPKILASSQEKGEIKTVAAPNVAYADSNITPLPQIPTVAPDKAISYDSSRVVIGTLGFNTDDTIDYYVRGAEIPPSDAISEAAAIEAATEFLIQYGYGSEYVKSLPVSAWYTVGGDPALGPWWNVVFIRHFAGDVVVPYDPSIKDRYPAEAIINEAAGTVTWYTENDVDNTVVAVNALTGEVPYAPIDTDNHNNVFQWSLSETVVDGNTTVTPTPSPDDPTVTPGPTATPPPTIDISDKGAMPDINAITKAQAIEAAYNSESVLMSQFSDEYIRSRPVTAYYLAGTAPLNAPLWVVIIADQEYYFANSNGSSTSVTSYSTILVNALTGEVKNDVFTSNPSFPE